MRAGMLVEPKEGYGPAHGKFSQTGATATVHRHDRRPEVPNALHPPGNAELSDVFDEFAADPELWVAIITGASRAFSAGNDLKYRPVAVTAAASRPAASPASPPTTTSPSRSSPPSTGDMAAGSDRPRLHIIVAAENALRPAGGAGRPGRLAGGVHRLPAPSAPSRRWA
jgi:hypothetical protein